MKSYLLLSFLLICSICYAQQTGREFVRPSDTTYFDSTGTGKQDTNKMGIKIIYLDDSVKLNRFNEEARLMAKEYDRKQRDERNQYYRIKRIVGIIALAVMLAGLVWQLRNRFRK